VRWIRAYDEPGGGRIDMRVTKRPISCFCLALAACINVAQAIAAHDDFPESGRNERLDPRFVQLISPLISNCTIQAEAGQNQVCLIIAAELK